MKVRITQTFCCTRSITVDVPWAASLGETLESAVEGEINSPSFDDPRWEAHYDLVNEDITAA